MDPNLNETISEVVCDVFEKLAFMFGEVADRDELPAAADTNVRATMTYSGATTGSLSVTVPQEVCFEIAANVLGTDSDEIEDAQSHDALKEVLNVLCGNLLTAVAGEDPVFDLSVPEIDQIDANAWTALVEDNNNIVFLIDDSPVIVRFTSEDSE